MKIIMLGIVGAGKGTQAAMLAKDFQVPHISTGDIFRDAVKNKTETGLKADAIMKSGGLVPDEIVLDIIKERLSASDTEKGYILDGFPRTVNQATQFERYESVDDVICISLTDEEVVSRLLGRRVCSGCGRSYNVRSDGEVTSCQSCGGAVVSRQDDNEETIRIRIAEYNKKTAPLIDHYMDAGKLRRVDGNADIMTVYDNIRKSITATA